MLRTRVLTGIAIAVVVVAAVLGLEPPYASAVFGLIWLIGADEWARLARFGVRGRVLFAALFLAIILAAIGGVLPTPVTDGLIWLAAGVWAATFVLVLRFPQRLPQLLIAAIGLVVLPAAWWSFHWLHSLDVRGGGLALAALGVVWAADIGAFFVGRTLGKTPLAPRVSPKKTWEGVVGGILASTLTGWVAALILGLPPLVLALIGMAVAPVSVVGDLGVSMLKRRAGLKDVGVLLPGHGGIMDRFDGVTAALPFFILGLQFAHVLD